MVKRKRKSSEEYSFRFVIEDELAPIAFVQLFDGENDLVHSGYGSIENLRVPRGMYRLRVELNEFTEEREYRITSDITDKLTLVKISSAMPLLGRINTHEYFSIPTEKWSSEVTLKTSEQLPNSIFLFFRYAHPTVPLKSAGGDPMLHQNFMILDRDRQVLFILDKENTRWCKNENKVDNVLVEHFAWCAFHVSVPSGQYYLHYNGERKREIPLYVFPRWQTQLFLMFSSEPVFSTTRIFIGRNGFNRHDAEAAIIDALLQKMHNGIYQVPPSIKLQAADGKWENPMFGIVVCYIYLLSRENSDDGLIETMRKNLEHRILDAAISPDIVALRLLSAIHKKERLQKEENKKASAENRVAETIQFELPSVKFNEPCMVAAGMKAVLNYAQTIEKDVTGDLVDKIFTSQRPDTIFTSYVPPPLPADVKRSQSSRLSNLLSRIWSTNLEAKFEKDNGWVTAVLRELLAHDKEGKLDLNDLAKSLRLPPKKVAKYVRMLENEGSIYTTVKNFFSSKERGRVAIIKENLARFKK
jgi:hypothetical protein